MEEVKTRTATIDGKMYKDVPEDVTDEELKAKIARTQVAQQSGTFEDFATGVAVGFSDLGGNLLEAVADTGEIVAGENKISDYLNSISDKQEEAAEFFRARGEDSPWASTIGELIPMAAGFGTGGGAAFTGLKALGSGSFVAGVTSGIVVDQVYADSDENIFNIVSPLMQDSLAEPLFEALSAQEDNSILEKRAKLLIEGAILGGTFETAFQTAPKMFGMIKRSTGKSFSEMSTKLQASSVYDYLKSVMPSGKEVDELPIGPMVVKDRETGSWRMLTEQERSFKQEAPVQIINQNSSFISKIKQQIFTSRGYLEPKAYDAFQGAKAAKRKLDTKAQHIATRMKIAMDKLPTDLVEKNIANINTAFNEGIKFLDGVKPEDRVEAFAKYHDLDMDIASEVLEARDLIDDLSNTILGTNVVDPKAKAIIADNIGKYTTRSYRLFEDVNYKPNDKVRRDAERYFADRAFKSQAGAVTLEESEAMGRAMVGDILGETTQEERNYFDAVSRINKGIFQGKKDIDDPVRALLGEVTEPSEKIMLSVQKMSQVTETYKFLDTLNKLGRGKYIFDAKSVPDNKIFSAKIEGTNSALDGLYTTPEMLSAIKNKEGKIWNLREGGDDPGMMKFMKSAGRKFLAAKAFSQKTKTIYSHVTQLRNYLGGLQFGVANGMSPFSKEGDHITGMLKNEILEGGDKALNTMYEKYQGLGIINTSVNVGEFRELMDTAVNAQGDALIGKIDELSKRYGAVQKTDRVLEQTYMATDDFFKIHGFHNELETLKAANPGTPIEVLEAEASEIIKNTFPNYDRVPKGIKALKELPVGNFFSFPAEITRTSVNIIKQASKEINSGNETIRNRGLKRLGGYIGSTGTWAGVGYGSAALNGMSPDEKRAADKTTETPWSKESERIYYRDSETGDLWANDTQFLNSYSTITEPFIAIAQEIYDGNKQGKDLDEYLTDAALRGMEKVLSPYLSGSIITTAMTDLIYASTNPEGRTANGKGIFEPGKDRSEQAFDAVGHLIASVTPGSIMSAKGLYEASIGKVHRTGGHQTKDIPSELMTNLLGIKFTKVDPEFNLKNATTSYVVRSQDLVSYQPNFEKTGGDIIEQYIGSHKEDFRLQQDLYEQFNAASMFIGRGAAYIQLEEQLGEDKASYIMAGLFMPKEPSDAMLMNLFGKTFSDLRHDYDEVEGKENETISGIFDAYGQMLATSLETLDTVDEKGNIDEEDKRILKAEGGYVSVPNAPSDPSERINKLTGHPYSVDAGEDPLSRMGFREGGWVTRQQYVLGGIVKKMAPPIQKYFKNSIDEAAIVRAGDSLAVNALNEDDFLVPTRVSYMNSNKSISKARLEKKGNKDSGNYDDILPIESKQAQDIIKRDGLEPQKDQTHLIVQNIIKQSKGESPVSTKVALATKEDISNIYADDNRSLYTSKSLVSDTEYSDSWRQLDDADVYKNVIPQSRAALDNLESKTDIRTDVLQTIDDFILKDEQKAEFQAIIDEYGFDKDFIDDVEDAIKPIPRSRVFSKNTKVSPEEFLKDSVVKKSVFRATTSQEPARDFLISMFNPREISTHVGSDRNQPQSLLLKHVGVADKSGVPRASESTLLKEFERKGTASESALTEYYVNIKKPLVINDDVSDWDARAIIADMRKAINSKGPKSTDKIIAQLDTDPTFWENANVPEDLEDGVFEYIDMKLMGDQDDNLVDSLLDEGVDLDTVDKYLDAFGTEREPNSFLEAIEKEVGPIDIERLDKIYTGSLEEATGAIQEEYTNAGAYLANEMESYRVNRSFKEYLKELGFDGIDYKNMGESSSKKGSGRSYIVFDPEQIKLAAAGMSSDPRVQKAKGGYVKARLQKRYGGQVQTPIGGLTEGTNNVGINKAPNEIKVNKGSNLTRALARRYG